MGIVYKVDGLGLWSVDEEKFVSKTNEDDEVLIVGVSDDQNKLEALKSLLEFEGYPTDKLESEANKLELLVSQNKDFILNMFILTSLDQEIPDAAMERFEALRSQISTFSGAAKLNLLNM